MAKRLQEVKLYRLADLINYCLVVIYNVKFFFIYKTRQQLEKEFAHSLADYCLVMVQF